MATKAKATDPVDAFLRLVSESVSAFHRAVLKDASDPLPQEDNDLDPPSRLAKCVKRLKFGNKDEPVRLAYRSARNHVRGRDVDLVDDVSKAYRAVAARALAGKLDSEAEQVLMAAAIELGNAGLSEEKEPKTAKTNVPRWDKNDRTLWLDDIRVKRYPRSATNQWLVLNSFQELNWPNGIDDPIPPSNNDVDCVDRLRNTVAALNKKQLDATIRFGVTNGGTKIYWTAGTNTI